MAKHPAGARDEASAAEIEHRPNVNQVRDEPVPASRDEDRRPEAVRRNEELAAPDSAPRTSQSDEYRDL